MNFTLDDIPQVALLDPNGREIYRGYYFRYPEYAGPGIYDGAPPKIPNVEGIACYDQGDWNLPNTPRFMKVTPPHRIVPLSSLPVPAEAKNIAKAAHDKIADIINNATIDAGVRDALIDVAAHLEDIYSYRHIRIVGWPEKGGANAKA